MKKTEMVLAGLFNPAVAISNLLRRVPIGTFEFRLALDGLMRPNYGYAMFHAAKQARSLGIKHLAAIEFGVAAGNGLLEMENIAEERNEDHRRRHRCPWIRHGNRPARTFGLPGFALPVQRRLL